MAGKCKTDWATVMAFSPNGKKELKKTAVCKKCGKTKPTVLFYKVAERLDTSACKSCKRLLMRGFPRYGGRKLEPERKE